MIDREKVIKGIDICLQRFHCGEDCPYYNDAKSGCMEQLREDALALLKEQEAVKPKRKSRHGSTTMYQHFCGNCMAMLHGKPKYCSNCGRKVKWE